MKVVISILFIISISAYNGYFLKWAQNGFHKFYNKIWHNIGAFIRVLVISIIFTNSFNTIDLNAIINIVSVLLISWMPYDCIINYIRFNKLLYDASASTGTVSQIDILLNGWKYYLSQVVALVSGIVILVGFT